MLEQKLEQDIKSAMLSGELKKANSLKMIKSALLDKKVAEAKREIGLSDQEVIEVLSKEAKKRQQSAEIYLAAGDQARADAELDEKKLISQYLPAELDDEALAKIIKGVINDLKITSERDIGRVIGQVKSQVGAQADGSRIANLVKEMLK